MSRSRTLDHLAVRSLARSPGRLLVLALLLAGGLVVRSAAALTVDTLCGGAVRSVAPALPPKGAGAVLSKPDQHIEYFTRPHRAYFGWRAEASPLLRARAALYRGPGGPVTVVSPQTTRTDPADLLLEPESGPPGGLEDLHVLLRIWCKELFGRPPAGPDEVLVPTSLADLVGLEPGDELELVPESGGEPVIFTVSGVYTPRGAGPFFELVLAAPGVTAPGASGPEAPDYVYMVLDRSSLEHLESWWTQYAVAGSGDPAERMDRLARTVYANRARAADLAVSLTGAAILVALLISLVERRRETAVWKMVGMTAGAILRVLAVDLALVFAVAVAAAVPVYRLVAVEFVLGTAEVSPAVLWGHFLSSVVVTAAALALAAAYPLALASAATASQLQAAQKIHLIRRRQVLRGWSAADHE
ncbi:MAG: hypothetical protein K6U08_00715 [Firmicutes bacterium]|nr:hypothetical protein [Bacillota bacterium]